MAHFVAGGSRDDAGNRGGGALSRARWAACCSVRWDRRRADLGRTDGLFLASAGSGLRASSGCPWRSTFSLTGETLMPRSSSSAACSSSAWSTTFCAPILVGRDTRMPDFVVLIATLSGLELFGLNGFIVGPVIAALFMADVESGFRKQGQRWPVEPDGPEVAARVGRERTVGRRRKC